MGVGRISDAKGSGDVFVVFFACGFMSFAKDSTGGVAFRLCLSFLSGGQVLFGNCKRCLAAIRVDRRGMVCGHSLQLGGYY